MTTGAASVLPPSGDAKLSTGRVHILMVPGIRFVNLRLFDFERQELGDVRSILHVEGRDVHGRTDPVGKVSSKIPLALADAQGQIEADTTVHGWANGRAIALQQIPDSGTSEGQRIRLDNLGYIAVGSDDAEEGHPSAWAIEEFQCEHDLFVDGDCGPTTQAKLVEVHGH